MNLTEYVGGFTFLTVCNWREADMNNYTFCLCLLYGHNMPLIYYQLGPKPFDTQLR